MKDIKIYLIQKANGATYTGRKGYGFNCTRKAKISIGGVTWQSQEPESMEELKFINRCVDSICEKDAPVEFSQESVKKYLDEIIEFWRGEGGKESVFYVDAYQSVRKNLFGEKL